MAEANEVNGGQPTTPEPQPVGGSLDAAAAHSTPTAGGEKTPPPNAGPDGQPIRNWQDDYSKLEAEHKKISGSYAELRKKLSEQGSEKNEYFRELAALKAQQKALLDAVNKAAEDRTYDPNKALEDFNTQGPDRYIDSVLEKRIKAIQENFDLSLKERDAQIEELKTVSYVKDCRTDKEHFPDFPTLEPTMTEIYLKQKSWFDQLPLQERVETLYEQAKLRHSQDALQKAEALGRAKSEAELGREAGASVPGGKGASGTPAKAEADMSSEEYAKSKGWTVRPR